MHRGGGIVGGQVQLVRQAVDAEFRQPFQRFLDDAQRRGASGCVVRQDVELQRQAFAKVAGGDARRIETLDLVQHREDFGAADVDVRQQGLGDGIQRFAQVAVIVDRIDDRRADALVLWRQPGEVQLPRQMVVQGFGMREPVHRIQPVVLAATAAACAPSVRWLPAVVDLGLTALLGGVFGGRCFGRDLGLGHSLGRLALGGLGPVEQRIALDRDRDLLLQLQ